MIDLARLRALHAVAVYGSVNGAATALGFTPSAISQQLNKLERETRTTLLEKRGRGVVLTDAAQVLAGTAAEVLKLVEQAEIQLEEQRGRPVGKVALGAFPTACRGLLPPVVVELAAEHPALDVTVLEIDPPNAVTAVERGDVDVAVVHDWETAPLAVPDDLTRHPIGEDVADLLVPAGHRLADREWVTAADLVGEQWLCQPPGSICHDWLVRTVRTTGHEPVVGYLVSEYQTQLEFLRAGVGVALMPRLGRAPLPDGVVAVRLEPVPTRRLYAVWRERTSRRPAIKATVDALSRVTRRTAGATSRGR
ncbi:LysR family transcriptional regulator [Kutzneria sp. CA-103260]|uniref:LysR family transcriptional regulator n=1 Tax=Kutzneria sp. CA-103260 TaxID=2802641 RepID=UPI001BAB5D9D|nr:LysR family transcriptional regulator [Kutzneria sp. CA-103260]QUQ66593.1 LysR family transcriptional regulator [Kutzneria sp. CA-103260]